MFWGFFESIFLIPQDNFFKKSCAEEPATSDQHYLSTTVLKQKFLKDIRKTFNRITKVLILKNSKLSCIQILTKRRT